MPVKMKIDLEENISFYNQMILSEDARAKNKYNDVEEVEKFKELQLEGKQNLGM